VDNQAQAEGLRIGAKSTYDKEKLSADQMALGLKIGLDAEKAKMQSQQRNQQPTKGE